MEKVLIGISGGIDSAVAAYLLKKEGYEVIGATMILCDNTDITNNAKIICDKLQIKHYIFDFRKEFKEKVINQFIKSYENGETPNPCVLCNKYFKFGLLYEKAQELGCSYIATGHYIKNENNKLLLCNNINKDQTYFINQINKDIIPNILFPLQNYNSKEEIIKIAQENNLIIEKNKESQEICFIPNDDYHNFLKDKIKTNENNNYFKLKNGQILGKHNGIHNYTIGQRKGLNISYKCPLYVININKDTNEIILGEEKDLYNNKLICNNVNLFTNNIPNEIEVKIRYKAHPAKAKIIKINETNYQIEFKEPQRAITKGQSIVFYKDNELLGGGTIIEIL